MPEPYRAAAKAKATIKAVSLCVGLSTGVSWHHWIMYSVHFMLLAIDAPA